MRGELPGGRLRHELLAIEAFSGLLEARVLLEDCQIEYTNLTSNLAAKGSDAGFKDVEAIGVSRTDDGSLRPRPGPILLSEENTWRSSQAEVCPARHAAQLPSAKLGSMTTRWPTSRSLTSLPTATMSPPPSWPNTQGMPGTCRVPSKTGRSEPQSPSPRIWTTTSSEPGSGSGQSSTTSTYDDLDARWELDPALLETM